MDFPYGRFTVGPRKPRRHDAATFDAGTLAAVGVAKEWEKVYIHTCIECGRHSTSRDNNLPFFLVGSGR